MIFGSGFTVFLMWMRPNLCVVWPLHPLGYTMLSSWATFKTLVLHILGLGIEV